jgi:uncharacterized Zn finger protein
VTVPKPGKVTGPQAQDMVAAAEMETSPTILARGRTYARQGQVIDVQCEPGHFTARIQGSHAEPYLVRLDRVTISGADRVAADCDCPYGCDFGWCKHAAALAYVGAFLMDNDSEVRARWLGEEVAATTAYVEPLTDDELAALRAAPQAVDIEQMLARAEAVAPYPRRQD